MNYLDRIISDIKKEKSVSKSVDLAHTRKKPDHKNDFLPYNNENLLRNEDFTKHGSIRKNVIFKNYQRNEEDKEDFRKKTSEVFLKNSKNIFAGNDINKYNFLSRNKIKIFFF